ncbi:MBL fold metallo-hydrolase RNA specificity domain-containing protein [Nocardioides sp.]|uniref:MBL fold metallo-hydrolase RNA specificity domain-containing protein n=1 Tax=Nocardioides sp. TaxID=35761 RepID=UPI003783EB5C
MSSPMLTFLGAAGTVTGSRFRFDAAGGPMLVDAGLYQGPAELRHRNWAEGDDQAATLAAVVVSHAHLDHCGYLPRLVRDGFAGRIICTPETAKLVTIVLRDSAHLQEEDARLANEHGFSKHRPALPLYDHEDVERTLPLLDPVGYDAPTAVLPGVTATLRPAGHILGSSSVLLDVDGERVVLSGDLGRPHHPLLRPPAPVPAVGTVVVESTYGDRTHEPGRPHQVAEAMRRTLKHGGCVLVPAFAVDRTELVLLELHRLVQAGELPRVPVYLDSPMALATLEVYRRAVTGRSAQLRPEARDLLVALEELHVRPVTEAADSIRLNRPGAPCIVVSASGMATGGRVVHHLAEQLPDSRNCVVLTGYQAVGTRGRQLLDGAKQVKIHGRYVPVRAEIVDDQDFSVHADGDELLAWLATAPEPPRTVYVVHGEEQGSARLAARISDELGWTAVVPKLGERVRLD